MDNNVSSVYIHIPFCEDICSYCDFCKYYYNSDLVDKYLVALKQEIINKYNGEIIKTIYIGGGTPSSLSLNQIKKLLDITKIFNVENLEFTFECNIENIDEDKIKLLTKYGVNRISIGVQTFNYDYLSFLNRKHTKDEVFQKISMIKNYIDNINIDLIYAISGETLDELALDLELFLKLDINHISTYSLIIEDNTILANMKIKPIDDELDYNMYKLICNTLKKNNYHHYEISNFSKPGYESKHNLVYWNNNEYYGFGMGASGYIDKIRYTNTKSINHYLEGNYIYIEDKLSFNEIIENALILGLRKIDGIDIRIFYDKYKIDLIKIDIISNLINKNKLIYKNNFIKINEDYIYTSNDILIEFMGVNYEKYI